jgi:TolB protein
MQNLLRLLFILGLAAAAAPAANARDIGDIVVTTDGSAIPVRVSSDVPELRALAQKAFGVHGRYRLVSTGYVYDINFSAPSPTQVRVDVTKGAAGTPVVSEVVTDASASRALLRAADVAVERTNGLGLKGFFTAQLAFVGERTGKTEVYTSDLFFSPGTVKQITHDRAFALMPRWSPDRSKVIYTSYRNGFPDIYLLDSASGVVTKFVSVQGTNQSARFSPNGLQVAMVLTGTGSSEVWVSDALGRGLTRLTHSDAVKASPCFSPDGRQLVFTMEPGPQLYVMPAGGGTPHRLVTGFSFSAEPDWNHVNPNLIACTVKAGRQSPYQIAVYDFSTGKAEVVYKVTGDCQEPSWLPDGRHLVYTRRDSRTSGLYILDTETGKSTPIVPQGFGSTQQASVRMP